MKYLLSFFLVFVFHALSGQVPKFSVHDSTIAQIEFKRINASGAIEQNGSGGALRLQHPTIEDSTLIQLGTYGHSYFNGGNIGIGTVEPQAALHVNGFNKLGNEGPRIKMKELTGTTSGDAQGLVQISHGIADPSKIIAVDIMLEVVGGIYVAPNTHTASEDNLILYNFFIDNDKINVQNNSYDQGIFPNPIIPSPIRARPMKIVVTYSE